MSDRFREGALLCIGEDALLDVGCCLDRSEVDSIQCVSWKSHTYVANKSHILPVRLLDMAKIDGDASTFVSARAPTCGSVSFDMTQPGAFQLALAAIKDSDLQCLSLFDPTGDPITEDEVAQIAAVAATVKVKDLRLYGRLAHLSPPTLHRLIFGFASINGLTLHGVSGNQFTDEHLYECGRKQIWRLYVSTDTTAAGPLAFSDEALLDYLFTKNGGRPGRRIRLSAFNASPKFVQKLVSRAHLPTDIGPIELTVKSLPLASQQLDGIPFTANRHFERLESGVCVTLLSD